MKRQPLIANQRTEVWAGAGLVLAGMYLLWDAWDGRGGRKPWWTGPFLPW